MYSLSDRVHLAHLVYVLAPTMIRFKRLLKIVEEQMSPMRKC